MGFSVPSDFKDFIHDWYADECRHAKSMSILYGKITGMDPQRAMESMCMLAPNFTALEYLFSDPLALLLAIALDEKNTAFGYAHDRAMYKEAGGEVLDQWMKTIARDEALHMQACLQIIRGNFSHRKHEIPTIMEQVEAYANKIEYANHFIFNHKDDKNFDQGFVPKAAASIVRSLCN